ncbi:MAG: TenA family transcriptional regulator [Gammaproteobacteria bacterium]
MFFEKLQNETNNARQEMLSIEQIQRGSSGQISLLTYVAYLTEAYHHVKHTVPLLMACGSKIPGDKEWLRSEIANYIEEELGHQEWILNDIKACGADSEKVRHSQPGPATELMVSYAYDVIARGNPVAFFGMILVLEGTSIALATNAADSIKESLNLPEQAFSYLASHGSLDVGHMEFFKDLMNRIDDVEDQKAIIHMANMVYKLYGDMFRSIPLD